MNEHTLQNMIREAISRHGTFFRGQVGTGWTGSAIRKTADGGVQISNARPFSTGLPAGFTDIFGATPVVITPEMVGKTVAVFCGIEVKTDSGVVRPEQKNFIRFMSGIGCRIGIARTVDAALDIVGGRCGNG